MLVSWGRSSRWVQLDGRCWSLGTARWSIEVGRSISPGCDGMLWLTQGVSIGLLTRTTGRTWVRCCSGRTVRNSESLRGLRCTLQERRGRGKARGLAGPPSRADVSDGNESFAASKPCERADESEGFVGSKPCGQADGNEGFVGAKPCGRADKSEGFVGSKPCGQADGNEGFVGAKPCGRADKSEGFVGSKPCGRADGNEGFVGAKPNGRADSSEGFVGSKPSCRADRPEGRG